MSLTIEPLVDVTLADKPACPHMSEARVAYWWRKSEVRASKRGGADGADVSTCVCCGGPVYLVSPDDGHEPYFPPQCRACSRKPFQPRMPYAESDW